MTAVAPVPTPVASDASGKTVALPDARAAKVTFVRGEQGADGIPVWELTLAGDPAVVPPPARVIVAPKAVRRGNALVGFVALLLVGAVVPAASSRYRTTGRRPRRRQERQRPRSSRRPRARASCSTGARSRSPRRRRSSSSGRAPRSRTTSSCACPGTAPGRRRRSRSSAGDHVYYRAQLETPAARLVVTTEPAGAEVAVDGRTVGRTPLGNVTLAADGRAHALRLRRHGFLDVTEEIALADGKDVVVDRKLAPAPRYGTIDLHVDPWAIVYLDGKQVGEAPVKGLQLPVGHHRLKLVNPVRHKQMMLAVDVPAKHAYRVKLP